MINLTECGAEILNLTDVKTAENALYSTPEKIIIGIAMPCVLIVGLAANLAFLFVIYRVSDMRTTTNFYLAHLAVSDIIFLTVAVLDKVVALVSSPISGDTSFSSSVGCSCYAMTVYITYLGSIGLITLVSSERYFALCSPAKHRNFSSKDRTLKLVTTNWVISVILASCITLAFAKLEFNCIIWPEGEQYDKLPVTKEFCTKINNSVVFKYIEYIQLIAFPSALIGNTIMYWRIIKSLSDRASSRKSTIKTRSMKNVDKQARNQVAWMLIVNGLVFFLCHLPFNVLNFVELLSLITKHKYMSPDAQRILAWVGRLTTFINAAANPFIYTTLSARYRQAYKEAFKFAKCWCCKTRRKFEIYAIANGQYVDDEHDSPL